VLLYPGVDTLVAALGGQLYGVSPTLPLYVASGLLLVVALFFAPFALLQYPFSVLSDSVGRTTPVVAGSALYGLGAVKSCWRWSTRYVLTDAALYHRTGDIPGSLAQ